VVKRDMQDDHNLPNSNLVQVLLSVNLSLMPIPVAARSKVWVCGRSLAGIVGLNLAGGMDVCLSVVSVVCCQLEVFPT
jgi:hypothetical protein